MSMQPRARSFFSLAPYPQALWKKTRRKEAWMGMTEGFKQKVGSERQEAGIKSPKAK